MNEKPVPLKVFGRSHYACQRCKISKMRCSGEKPACANCISSNKRGQCVYPTKDRKIMLMESDLDKLHEKVSYLESLLSQKESEMQLRDSYQVKHQDEPALVPSFLNLYNNARHAQNAQEQTQHAQRTQQLTSMASSHTQNHIHNQNHNQNHNHNQYSTVLPTLNHHHTQSHPLFRSPIQRRSQLKTNPQLFDFLTEDFLLPDRHRESLLWNLNFWEQPLPPKDLALRYFEAVLTRYAREFFLVEIDKVVDLMNTVYEHFYQPAVLLEKILHGDLCHFYIVMAFGSQQLNSTQLKLPIPGMEYYITAMKLFNLGQEELNRRFIQSAILLALYLCNLNRYNTVYTYFGVALRAAVAIGLHRRLKTILSPDLTQIQRNELLEAAERDKFLWWTVFIIDSTWAQKMSLPVHIHYTDTDVDLPTENEYPIYSTGEYNGLSTFFDFGILESNVHLAKYITKFVRIIYGPKIRSFLVNYINTDIFNQKSLIKSVTDCLHDLIKNLELTILSQYDRLQPLVDQSSRRLANLFLRYDQLVVLITKPLLSLMFNVNASKIVTNLKETEQAIFKGLHALCASVDLVYNLFINDKVFEVGFWDSQYLYTSLLMLIMSGLTGRTYPQLQKGYVMLQHLAECGNINAQNSIPKLKHVLKLALKQPNTKIRIDMDQSFDDYRSKHNFPPPLELSPSLKRVFQPDEDTFVKAHHEVEEFENNVSPHEYEKFREFYLHNAYILEPVWRELQKRTQNAPLIIFPGESDGNSNQSFLNEIIERILEWDNLWM